ncbi:MAG TPA: Uma2 family endonuclease [Pyrinomonadaceae bacterium]|jgi:Uma2 family endonuclease
MTSQPKITYLTPGEYLAVERQNEYRSEYIDGEMVAMTGASRRHNIIAVNITSSLDRQLADRPCEIYAGDMRVRIASRREYAYTYPDVVVVCGEPQFEDEHLDTLLNPTVIVEVLSESTERYDRGKKFSFYRAIESLAEYVLVAQDEFKVEQYVQRPDGRWLLSDHSSLETVVELASVKCSLALRDVYKKVSLPPSDLKEGQLL